MSVVLLIQGAGDRATSSGINDVIMKPFNKKNVEDMILVCPVLCVCVFICTIHLCR